jgi:hypothetical protein
MVGMLPKKRATKWRHNTYYVITSSSAVKKYINTQEERHVKVSVATLWLSIQGSATTMRSFASLIHTWLATCSHFVAKYCFAVSL